MIDYFNADILRARSKAYALLLDWRKQDEKLTAHAESVNILVSPVCACQVQPGDKPPNVVSVR